MKRIIVIEICERAVCTVKECKTMTEAIVTANALLEDHLRSCGEYEPSKEGAWPAWCRATKDSPNAWCNLRDLTWDAYIIELKEKKSIWPGKK